ncbi:M20/M25/M40 family metallo-hydrolase [Muriicola soli]|uniref:M20/M25/M40 family metallo-hydrolase n=1 Tax=Muriicola soli TaxID=2507538 RepID=A0A411E7T1_9FLAO|nr:M20/M25/M40 family metallo-hydrolase [Muriicola soli]QBA63530.1 M20/M25/M40 family metallo-hydrolase [Muriicola soli]
MNKIYCFLTLAFCTLQSFSQDEVALKSQVRHAIDELVQFVAIPNDALDEADINRNISWLTNRFNERGFNTSVLPTEGRPLFFAALPMEDEKPTVLIYMHFDGQSVDAAKWNQPNPYKVELKALDNEEFKTISFDELKEDVNYEWRLFGRSTSDDKGPIIMLLNAIDLLRKDNKTIPFNIKVILDGEEEKSSKPLPVAVKNYRDLLLADFLMINDGPVHPSGKPTVVYGCRGITTLSLTTHGPVLPQHSGHYGNYAPNPGFLLAKLLAGMKDAEGRVTIPNFYKGIEIDEATMEVLKSVPDDNAEINANLAIHSPDKVGSFYQESLQYPSLNIRGMGSAWIGEKARTIVPASATAEIDIRLVPESDGRILKNLVRSFIKDQGYYLTDSIPTREERMTYPRIITFREGSVTDAFRTDLDNRYGDFLVRSLNEGFEQQVVQIRIMGGTVPIAPFVNELQIPAFIVPMVNPDNNQHSPNENLRIGQLAYGIKAFYQILSSSL